MELRTDKTFTEKEALQLSPLQLAYIGDTVWELMVRQRLVFMKLNVHHMHSICVDSVNAHAQSEALELIAGALTEKENEIVRRGRNAHTRHPVPRNQDPGDYGSATGFEALLGFLYVTGNDQRIIEICRKIESEGKNNYAGAKTSEG